MQAAGQRGCAPARAARAPRREARRTAAVQLGAEETVPTGLPRERHRGRSRGREQGGRPAAEALTGRRGWRPAERRPRGRGSRTPSAGLRGLVGARAAQRRSGRGQTSRKRAALGPQSEARSTPENRADANAISQVSNGKAFLPDD